MKPKNESRPKYWRSLAELEGDPKFHEFVEREFRSPTEQTALDSQGRRRFMQLMGASFALAGCSWKEEKLLPHTVQPDGFVPGVAVHYSTVVDIAGVATGLRVKSFDGRPIKIEGNPLDASTKGGTGPFHQAQILSLYDPDRSTKVYQGNVATTWEAFDAALLGAYQAAVAKGGNGFAILSGATSSPSVARLRDRLKKAAPGISWTAYEASYSSGPDKGLELAFGRKLTAVVSPEKADVLVALDSDIASPAAVSGIGNMRAIASRRDADHGEMSRIYAFEPTLSEVGSLADHRFTVKPSQIPAIVAYLDAQISAAKAQTLKDVKLPSKEQLDLLAQLSGAQTAPDEAALGGSTVKAALDVIVKDLLGAKSGATLVSIGSKYAPELHAVVARINVALGSTAISFIESGDRIVGGVDELAALVADIEANKVETLLILGANPVYDAPFDLGFAAALAKVKNSFHLGLYRDETASKCAFHAPETHFLESFGDATAADGERRLAQPLIDPVLGGRSSLEVLGRLLGLSDYAPLAIVKATSGLGDDAFQKALHNGVYGAAAKPVEVKLQPIAPLAPAKSDGLEVIFDMDPALFDGRFANNGWLQELPHPLTKLAWGNAAMVSPATATELKLKDGFHCKVTVEGQTLELPALVVPGQADGTVALQLGYGREAAGVVGGSRGYAGSISQEHEVEIVGANTYALRSSKSLYFASGTVSGTDVRADVAITQDLWAIDDIGKQGQHEREDQLIREATLAEYKEHPSVIEHKVHHPPLLSLWQPPVSYDGHKWGLAIDLNKCTGCASCIVACQSENNTAIVGRKEVALGREMTWIRVERYYKGTDKKATVRQQPVMCQQCENAPCEQVCPVGATMHTREGLNDMVYNRCIGTRYCSNNCPYKVRRFNYRNYNLETIGITPYTANEDPRGKLKAMAFNPEVTVRGRGVMEKCTFCVQRIQNVKIQAKNKKRPIADGEIQTACEQACPAGAIVFGDLNDKKSKVAALQNVPRAYELLAELNNRPRVNYLARISNPHPELSTQDGNHSEHH